MSQGWENHEPAVLEFVHGRVIDLFHEWRIKTHGKDKLDPPVTGTEIADFIWKAKMEAYKKYPKQVNSKAIPKSEI
jgi:hypothetical protein